MPTAKVRVREIEATGHIALQYFQDVAISGNERPKPSDELIAKWEASIELLCKLTQAKVGRITQISESQMSTLTTYFSEDTLPKFESVIPLGLASYSETIIGTNSSLYIKDATSIPLWENNFDLRSGYKSIIGVPIEWPSHETFGTLELLSNQPLELSRIQQALIGEFQVSILGDLRQLHLESQLEFFTTIDPLTQVSTRRTIQDQLEFEFMRARRTRSPFAIGFIHLTNLKDINRDQGNPVGDATLEDVATAVVETSRATDSLGRWSDAHFLLICPETGTSGLETMKSKLNSQLDAFTFTEKVEPQIETQWILIEGQDKSIEEILHHLKF
tara:strand:- start:467 stop:1459 length:993 start_codon:yes stop_codon:yes gene_type:complete